MSVHLGRIQQENIMNDPNENTLQRLQAFLEVQSTIHNNQSKMNVSTSSSIY